MLGAQDVINAHIEKVGRLDHSTAGAQNAFNTLDGRGKLLAYEIAGHHAIAFYKTEFIHIINEKNEIGAKLNGVNQFHCSS